MVSSSNGFWIYGSYEVPLYYPEDINSIGKRGIFKMTRLRFNRHLFRGRAVEKREYEDFPQSIPEPKFSGLAENA
ncbi:MAG: hypothetical protein EAX95_14260 [Candidatus Thorarchaeota archaeon]|nr:hypothetical protein [Candidatus Thorarchaeota archaeon]